MANSYTIQTIKQINNLYLLGELIEDDEFLGHNLELKIAESIYRDHGSEASKKIGKILLAISN